MTENLKGRLYDQHKHGADKPGYWTPKAQNPQFNPRPYPGESKPAVTNLAVERLVRRTLANDAQTIEAHEELDLDNEALDAAAADPDIDTLSFLKSIVKEHPSAAVAATIAVAATGVLGIGMIGKMGNNSTPASEKPGSGWISDGEDGHTPMTTVAPHLSGTYEE